MLDQSMKATVEDINQGRVRSFLMGRRRRVFVPSIHELAEQRLLSADPNCHDEHAARASKAALEKHRRERDRGQVEGETQQSGQ
jgi:hypothetical protein